MDFLLAQGITETVEVQTNPTTKEVPKKETQETHQTSSFGPTHSTSPILKPNS